MENNKKTDFYQIKISRPNQVDMSSLNYDDSSYNEKCKEIIKDAIDVLIKSNDPSVEFKENFIEFIDIDDDFAFGIVGRANSVERGILKRIKDNNGNEVKKTGYLEENLKYFIIRLSDLQVSIIKNSQGPQIVELFTSFIKSYILNVFPNSIVYVNPVIDKDAFKKIGKMNTLCKIGIKFSADSQLARSTLSLNELLEYDNSNIIGTTIEVKFKNQVMPKKLKEFIDDEGNISNFEKFEITGDQGDNEQTVELIKRHLIKKVALDLTDEELTDANKYINKIKNALISSFL